MNEWNYLTAEFTMEELRNAIKLNELGQDGWELAHMERIISQGPVDKVNINSTPTWMAVFKKLMYEEREEPV